MKNGWKIVPTQPEIEHDSELAAYEGMTSLIMENKTLKEVLEDFNSIATLSERQLEIITNYYNKFSIEEESI